MTSRLQEQNATATRFDYRQIWYDLATIMPARQKLAGPALLWQFSDYCNLKIHSAFFSGTPRFNGQNTCT